MRNVILISQSKNAALTNDHLIQCAMALTLQNREDFGPAWRGQKDPMGKPIDADATFSVAQQDAGIPSDSEPMITQDELTDAPGDLGYHQFSDGIPNALLGLTPILQNGGSLLVGPSAWSSVASHEGGSEMLGDPSGDVWIPVPDSDDDLAFELADPCEAFGYPKNVPAVGALPAGQVWMSDFVLPSYFVKGAKGPYTFLNSLPGPFTKGAACYQILRNRKTGEIRNEFGDKVTAARRAYIEQKCATPGTRHHKRHHGHKVNLRPGEVCVFHNGASVTLRPDGLMVIRTALGLVASPTPSPGSP